MSMKKWIEIIEASMQEGYTVLPPINRERYGDREHEGLEGPFRLRNGMVVYYDPKMGAYYDPDTDMFLSYDEYQDADRDTEAEKKFHPGTGMRREGLGESDEESWIVVDLRDAPKALMILDDQFRGEYKTDATDVYKFADSQTANDVAYTFAQQGIGISAHSDDIEIEDSGAPTWDSSSDEDEFDESALSEDDVNEEAYDVIRDYMAMGYSRAEAEAEARRRYPEEFDAPRRQSKPSVKPELVSMTFFNVPADREQEAKDLGLKQTKAGKWYLGLYNTSNDKRFDIMSVNAVRAFGQGKEWKPKKTESVQEGISITADSAAELKELLALAGMDSSKAAEYMAPEQEVCPQCGEPDCTCPPGECTCGDEPEVIDYRYETDKDTLVDVIKARMQKHLGL